MNNLFSGWIFIDKHEGITSFQVVHEIRKILQLKKIGHCGTLDPFATGILGIAIGEATKSIPYYSKKKEYKFKIVFGESRDTDDLMGEIISITNTVPKLEEINECLTDFVGDILQVPPNYSAVKVHGRRAYVLARNKENFNLKEKKITIDNLQCTDQENEKTFSFVLNCSSGTYVRALARDIAIKLGSLGYVSYLRRTKLGRINEKDIILLEKFKELVHIGDHFGIIHSIEDVLDDIPAVRLDNKCSKQFHNGLNIDFCNKSFFQKPLLIMSENKFLGIGQLNQGNINPIRVFN
jgi:tRNA pseudouridine55 synthase